MTHRDDAARRAAAHVSDGLDRQHEPPKLAVDGWDVHPGPVEQGVGPYTPGHALEADVA